MWELCSRFFSSVFSFCKISFTDNGSRMWLPDCSKFAVNWKNGHDITILRYDVIVIFFDVVLFFLSSLVTGPSFMPISSLVLELWQFSFIRDWPEIWRSEIPSSDFWLISEDWGEKGIPYLAQRSLIKCYWMLPNARVTAFTVSELLKENQNAGKITPRFIITTVLPMSAFWVTRCLRSIKLFNAIDNLWERNTTLCVLWNCQGNFSLNS